MQGANSGGGAQRGEVRGGGEGSLCIYIMAKIAYKNVLNTSKYFFFYLAHPLFFTHMKFYPPPLENFCIRPSEWLTDVRIGRVLI